MTQIRGCLQAKSRPELTFTLSVPSVLLPTIDYILTSAVITAFLRSPAATNSTICSPLAAFRCTLDSSITRPNAVDETRVDTDEYIEKHEKLTVCIISIHVSPADPVAQVPYPYGTSTIYLLGTGDDFPGPMCISNPITEPWFPVAFTRYTNKIVATGPVTIPGNRSGEQTK